MILDANGKPIKYVSKRSALVEELNRRSDDAGRVLGQMLTDAFREQIEADRVARFRRLNGLSVEFKHPDFGDCPSWDGSNYFTYGDLLK